MPPFKIAAPCLTLMLGLSWAPGLSAQTAKDPDWPCVQILVPQIAPGQIWAGPDIDGQSTALNGHDELAGLARQALEPTTPVETVDSALERIAPSLGPERNQALTAMFASVFETMARERAAAVEAVKRYARQQRVLLERIAGNLKRIDGLDPQSQPARELGDEVAFDRRLLEDRRRALKAVCDQPVHIEQRLGQLARVIAAHLE